MILILRIFGVLSAIYTLIVFLASVVTEGLSGPEIGLILFGLFWTVLWFFLAHLLVRRRRMREHVATMMPCTHCGSESSPGYRICGDCGRVKDAVLL